MPARTCAVKKPEGSPPISSSPPQTNGEDNVRSKDEEEEREPTKLKLAKLLKSPTFKGETSNNDKLIIGIAKVSA